ncbi:CdaR family protein [Bombilactobacillus thymidiniphilus]|uniref:CdaR family protein n=1 Tax=Bombilactobacillus thymidiniphilus TaxID=2923363 RepID=A0ABY4PE75_9LACO|nr:CdaR family protein [Bombilactobacillus thymidiniphilus]UQS83811.1 CdaR family protein [Bombilactobacillus thymidiniphilus]
MKKWRKFANSKYFYILLSFLVTIWIYWSVSLPSIGSTRSGSAMGNTTNANRTTTLNMKLELNSDSKNYFITGYPKKVAVKLQGPEALVTATKNTRNFTTYLDLHNLGIGHHRVLVRQSGLNNNLKYSIKPRYVNVDIEPRSERIFPIQVKYNLKNIANGYQASEATVTPQVVHVVGARDEVQRIDQVVARAKLAKDTSTNFHQEVMLQALDDQGRTLSVLLSPQTVQVRIGVFVPSKKVNLKFVAKNANQNYTNYSFTSDVKEVKIFAKQSVLDRIDHLEIPIDINKVGSKKSTVITINQVNSDIIDSSPRTIKVFIKNNNDADN